MSRFQMRVIVVHCWAQKSCSAKSMGYNEWSPRVVSISLVGALGRIPSLIVFSMARFDINTKNSPAQVIVVKRSMRSGTLVI